MFTHNTQKYKNTYVMINAKFRIVFSPGRETERTKQGHGHHEVGVTEGLLSGGLPQ